MSALVYQNIVTSFSYYECKKNLFGNKLHAFTCFTPYVLHFFVDLCFIVSFL